MKGIITEKKEAGLETASNILENMKAYMLEKNMKVMKFKHEVTVN